MRLGTLFRLCVLWGLVAATSSASKAGKKKVTGRRSRQVFEAEAVEGVWSLWGEWSGCSQACGVGVSHRSRKCLPPPPPQVPPLSHSPPNWGGYIPGAVGGPVISAMRPYYPSLYPGQRPPYYSPPMSPNHNQGLPLYRDTPPGGGADAPVPAPANPFYQPEFSPPNQDPVPGYRSPYHTTARGYNQPTRVLRRPTSPGSQRAGGSGNRRSVSSSRDSGAPRRSPAIRPGQFGYGRVPFSLPLLRPNRQARHTDNDTDAAGTATLVPGVARGSTEGPAEEVKDREAVEEEERENSPPAAQVSTTVAAAAAATTPLEDDSRLEWRDEPPRHRPPPHPSTEQRRVREPERASSPHPSSRASSPSRASSSRFSSSSSSDVPLQQHRRQFDWHSITAPPPHAPPFAHPHPNPHPYAPDTSPQFSSPLHRPPTHIQHAERELRLGLGPQPQAPVPGLHQPGVYPLQHPQSPYQAGVEGREGEGRAARNYRCPGAEREHRRCFSQVCAGSALDSRAEQCAAFDTQEFVGRLYNWEPFTEVGVDKQCELICRPAGYRFFFRQAERVRDGTPCFNVTTNDVCVGGQCLTEGCDGVLGSGSVVDRCGVCDGRDSACRKVTGSFQNATVPLGYHKILDIPPRATFINITERQASPNYLALRSGTGASVVNGRLAVDAPGEYQAGGTTFTYKRPRAQAEGREERGESLTAPGPTTTQLQLYIIFHRQNPGIDYEFYIPVEKEEAGRERPREREAVRERPRERESDGGRSPLRSAGSLTVSVEDPIPPPPPISLPSFPSSSSFSSSSSSSSTRSRPRSSAPNRNARIPPRTDLPPDTQSPFVWRRGGLTECSVSCGKGSQYRMILCVNRHTDQEVPERKCDSAAKPIPEEEPCNTHHCPPFWEASGWSECSVSCGQGLQQRQLQCRQSFGNRSTMVHPQRCANLTPLESTQACQLQLCSYWEVSSDWSMCSVDCGVGRRTRSVSCVTDPGNIVNEKECNSRLRPQGSEECNMGPCVTNWYFTDWSNTCSAQCGPGVQRRDVVCLTRGGRDGGGGGDCVGEKPAEMKACNRGACVPTTMWYSSPWTQCNVVCGNGTQRRDIICVKKMGSDFSVVAAGECAHLEKPVAVQECAMGACRPQWFTTEWSACSRSCGKGLQVREVRCLRADKLHNHECDSDAKPEQEQICNIIPCSPQVTDENCRDRRHNCMMVVQARLCVYSYYKTACCASCTQSAQRAKRH